VRKAGESGGETLDGVQMNEKERMVVKALHSMPETIRQAAVAYSPAMVANYAYDLAKAFNSFYQDTPILKETDPKVKHFRVMLCAMVATALKNTMNILGIEVPERM
jgi:arginyl-tRNA synthetase